MHLDKIFRALGFAVGFSVPPSLDAAISLQFPLQEPPWGNNDLENKGLGLGLWEKEGREEALAKGSRVVGGH